MTNNFKPEKGGYKKPQLSPDEWTHTGDTFPQGKALLLFLVLGAEVEGDHHGDDDHGVIGGDGVTQAQDHKDGHDRHGDHGFDL